MVKEKKSPKARTSLKMVSEDAAATADGEANPFAAPEEALVEGSEMQLKVLTGNDLEAPEDEEHEKDENADAARDRLKKVFTTQDRCFWDIAKDMSYIANKKSYQAWGYKTFESFLDAEFKMSKRKGQYYVQVFNYFESGLKASLYEKPEAYDALMDTIRAVGWTKGRVLAREQIVIPENVEEVTERLKTCGYRDLETYCKAAKSSMSEKDREESDDNNTIKTERMAFQVSLPQKQDIEDALLLAQNTIGRESTRSSLLAWICRDFVSTNVAAQGKETASARAETFHKFERLSGTSLIVIDDESKTVVYGQETLEKLSAPDA